MLLFPLFFMFYELISYLSHDMYTPAFALISEEFHVSSATVRFTFASWLLGMSFVQLILGPLSDKSGRRPLVIGGCVLFLIATAGCALAPSIIFLTIARFFQGVGICSMVVAGYASIHESFPDKQAIQWVAVIGSVIIAAPMLGPVLGGAVLEFWSWRTIFWSLFLCALPFLWGLYVTTPETNPPSQSLKLNLKEIVYTYVSILKNTQFTTNSIALGLFNSGSILWIALSPFLCMQLSQWSMWDFSLAQIPIFGSFSIAALIVRLFIHKIPSKFLIATGVYATLIGTIFTFIYTMLYQEAMQAIIVGIIIYSFGIGLILSPLNRAVFVATPHKKGVVSSLYQTIFMGTGTLICFFTSFQDGNFIFFATVLLMIALGGAAMVYYDTLRKILKKPEKHVKSHEGVP